MHTVYGRAVISASSLGNNEIVAAIAGASIVVIGYCIVCTTAVTVKFKSGTGGSDLSGAMPCGANGGLITPQWPDGHFATTAGESLNLVLGGAVQVSGYLYYQYKTAE